MSLGDGITLTLCAEEMAGRYWLETTEPLRFGQLRHLVDQAVLAR